MVFMLEKLTRNIRSPQVWQGAIWLSLSISYVGFFVVPTFLVSNHMQRFALFPLSNTSIGVDLRETLGGTQSWVLGQASPYASGLPYGPVTVLLLAPLVWADYPSLYRVFTLVNLACYVTLSFLLPVKLARARRIPSAYWVILVAGAVSYGLQFELERGQWNIIAALLAFAAIWLFHEHHRYRLVAYALMILAVQLKIYPIIYVLLMVDDWSNCRTNVKHLLATLLGIAGASLVLGTRMFSEWLHNVIAVSSAPFVWEGNHSIFSFTAMAANYLAAKGVAWPQVHSSLIRIGLELVVIACIVIVILSAQRAKISGANPYLLLACTLAALTLPSTSHDYTLSVLIAPMAVLFLSDASAVSPRYALPAVSGVAILALCVAYASTLFSYSYKPSLLSNNFPALLIMLLCVSTLSWLRRGPTGRESAL
jgi:hypothetical protein